MGLVCTVINLKRKNNMSDIMPYREKELMMAALRMCKSYHRWKKGTGSVHSFSRAKTEFADLMEMHRTFIITGNNGGNLIEFEVLNDNQIRIKVGDCCVYIFNVVVTAEVLSNFFAQLYLTKEKPILQIMADMLAWSEEINKKYLEGCYVVKDY